MKPIIRLSNPFDGFWVATVLKTTSWGPRTPMVKVRARTLDRVWQLLRENAKEAGIV